MPGIAYIVAKLFISAKGRYSTVCQAENLTRVTTNLLIAEGSLKDRRLKVQGISSLKQLSGLHLFMNGNTVAPDKNRAIYSGTNLGDVIGPISYDSWQDSWKLPIDVKVKLYGENRRAVGGRSDGRDGGMDDDFDEEDAGADEAADAEAEASKPTFNLPMVGAGRGKASREKTAVEPVAWHSLPADFYHELATSYYGKIIIDLTPGAGNCALHCALKSGMGYLGICFRGDRAQLRCETEPSDMFQVNRMA